MKRNSYAGFAGITGGSGASRQVGDIIPALVTPGSEFLLSDGTQLASASYSALVAAGIYTTGLSVANDANATANGQQYIIVSGVLYYADATALYKKTSSAGAWTLVRATPGSGATVGVQGITYVNSRWWLHTAWNDGEDAGLATYTSADPNTTAWSASAPFGAVSGSDAAANCSVDPATAMVYNATLSKWVTTIADSSFGAHGLFYSSNGTTWTACTGTGLSIASWAQVFAIGGTFYAISADKTKTAVSTDGIAWVVTSAVTTFANIAIGSQAIKYKASNGKFYFLKQTGSATYVWDVMSATVPTGPYTSEYTFAGAATTAVTAYAQLLISEGALMIMKLSGAAGWSYHVSKGDGVWGQHGAGVNAIIPSWWGAYTNIQKLNDFDGYLVVSQNSIRNKLLSNLTDHLDLPAPGPIAGRPAYIKVQ